MCEITDNLRQLMAAGFRFVHPRNARGHVVAVTGVRTHHDVVDVFSLYGENDANAARMCASEPDVLSPRNVLWRTSGTAVSVIEALLTLPEPGTASATAPASVPAATARSATRQSTQGADPDRGCWVQTRPGRSTWLPASA
jgi:hypothetical protein